MNNAIGLIGEDLRRHRVTVTLPGEQGEKSLYLILITAKTSRFHDFSETYGNQATKTHVKIARRVFGEGETENVYGVLVDENLRMIFAFNRDFADYDSKKKTIVFKDIDDVLIDRIEVKENKESPIPRPSSGNELPGPSRGSGRGAIKYSLTEI